MPCPPVFYLDGIKRRWGKVAGRGSGVCPGCVCKKDVCVSQGSGVKLGLKKSKKIKNRFVIMLNIIG